MILKGLFSYTELNAELMKIKKSQHFSWKERPKFDTVKLGFVAKYCKVLSKLRSLSTMVILRINFYQTH